MNNDLSMRAKTVIKQITYATLSTVSTDGEPWNTPVYFAYDEHYALYWGSHTGSQHSQNIKANGRAFIIIYNSTVAPGQGEGVYIKATAKELTNTKDKTFAHSLIQERRNPIPYWKVEQVQVKAPIRLYKATPQIVWMNDEGRFNGHYIDTRTEINLSGSDDE